jgi:hypothetical protein
VRGDKKGLKFELLSRPQSATVVMEEMELVMIPVHDIRNDLVRDIHDAQHTTVIWPKCNG